MQVAALDFTEVVGVELVLAPDLVDDVWSMTDGLAASLDELVEAADMATVPAVPPSIMRTDTKPAAKPRAPRKKATAKA